MNDEHIYVHSEAFRLTGDEWCPYPDHQFYISLSNAKDDDEKKSLIMARRDKTFPFFLVGHDAG